MTPQTPPPGTNWIDGESCVKILGVSHGEHFLSYAKTRRLFARAHDWAGEEDGEDKLFFQGDASVYHNATEPESRIVFECTLRGSAHHMLLWEFLGAFAERKPR